VSSGTCQQSVEVLSKSVTFLDFQLSQGSVATYCRCDGNLCTSRIYLRITWWNNYENRSTFPKLFSKIKWLTFFGTRCISAKNRV